MIKQATVLGQYCINPSIFTHRKSGHKIPDEVKGNRPTYFNEKEALMKT
jgi:hypothetical protein